MDSQQPCKHADPNFPVEMFEHLISVCCFSQLLWLSDVNNLFRALILTEVSRRLERMRKIMVKKGLDLNVVPICFYLSDFNSDICKVEQNDNEVRITGTSFILKFLRLFGSEIKYIVFDFFGATEEQIDIVFSCAREYCPNLTRMVFGNLDYDLRIENPFTNVEFIFFQQCRLYDHLCDIKSHFPNVKDITISDDNRFESLDKVIVFYNGLEKMEIYSTSIDIVNAVFLQILNPDVEITFYNERPNILDIGN